MPSDKSTGGGVFNLPGLSSLREAVASHAGSRILRGASLRRDVIAGLYGAIGNVPDGMANGVIVGVNPVFGLYSNLFGPIFGASFSSTQLMIVATTAAASLSSSQALAGWSGEERGRALVAMVILIGAYQILFGLLRLGRLTSSVSYSVTAGFLTGISVLLILSQLPTVTGYDAEGSNRIGETIDLILNLDEVNPLSLAVAGVALLLAIFLPRTRLGNLGRLVAIALPSALVPILDLDGVQLIRDVGSIPTGIPLPMVPALSDFTVDVITGALAVSTVILVQGAGVSLTVPNPDGSRRSISRDFIAQHAANVASGFFQGLPVGGSMSATALNLLNGERSRWAGIFAGIWMAVVVIALPWLVLQIAMPTLGALLILAGSNSIKPIELDSIWRTGWPSRVAVVATFVATLLLPIQVAVGLGVVISVLFHLFASSSDVSVVELVERPDGRLEERPSQRVLRSNGVTILDIYGHLYFAGARTLERLLPAPRGARNPAVIIRLRGRSNIGATLLDVLASYAKKLEEVNGRLYLTGVRSEVHDQLVRTHKVQLTGPVQLFEETPIIGESTHQAYEDAKAWLVTIHSEEAPENDSANEREAQ